MKSNVKIEFAVDETKYDDCNPLLLPKGVKNLAKDVSKKSRKKEIKSQLLSKKKKKKLEKIIERKNRKLNRSKLISDLQQYQVGEKEYDLMPSTSVVQTTGKKRINELLQLYHSINKKPDDSVDATDEPPRKRFKMPKIKFKSNEKNFNRKDPNVVGFDQSSSGSSSEQTDEEDENPEDKVDEKSDTCVPNPQPEVKECDLQKNVMKTEDHRSSYKKEPEKKPLPKTIYVAVNRPEEIQKARLKLPILAEEHNIMDSIMYNSVVIICGETGSGKTTQIPQFLYEGGYTLNDKMIGITEPRRVAAISMSKRVKYELNLTEAEVSYQIRFEGNVTPKTKIKFMTDGILMKEIERDFLLSKYSAIVIDEAHERSLYSDILIGFLSRVIQIREKKGDPLKLIIMSATLRIEDFTENVRLFKIPPPVIKIDSRQFPVSIHFSKHTNPRYMEEAFKKVCKIHSTSPPGGILIFVTGRKEVLNLCRKLKEQFPLITDCTDDGKIETDGQKNDETGAPEVVAKEVKTHSVRKVNLDIYSIDPIENEPVANDFDFSDDESNPESDFGDDSFADDLGFMTTKEPLYCLPLYSMMPSHKQALVFKNPPPNCRLCVIATNVAETSLTIPNIKYVIDTGKIKNKVYDQVTGISTYVVEWTSKASADQRAGRAGRTSAGHCYRLYSSAVFNDQFKRHSDPEILLKPIDDLLLQMKAIGIDNVINFPFPTQPNVEALVSAEKRLFWLDALEEEKVFNKKNKEVTRFKITRLGKLMANFPVNPRYSKMLCLSNQFNLMPYTLAIISALTVQEVFLNDENETTRKRRRNIFANPNCLTLGDLMALLSAIGAANFEGLSVKFCEHYGLRYNAMVEINKLRLQLLNQVKQITKTPTLSADLPVPSDHQVKLIGQLFLCGFADHIAKRIPYTWVTEADADGNIKKKKQKPVRNCYQSIEVDDYVFISPHSVLFNETPEYVAYHEVFESSKMYMRNLIVVQPEWLPIYASKHCTFSNPLADPAPRYDPNEDKVKCHCRSTFSRFNWEMPAVEIEFPEGTEKYRFFAYFLFKGDVLKWFAKNVKYMSAPAVIFTKNWSFVQPKVENVVKSLSSNRICSKRALMDIWKCDKKFLLNEYLDWIQESRREIIRQCWPPQ